MTRSSGSGYKWWPSTLNLLSGLKSRGRECNEKTGEEIDRG